jgi:3,4-dihydroxy 2-butanone 4-phosphate synthase/GTP cyclohydrolase II
MPVASIKEAIADIKAGQKVILVDDEDRENEGDLTMAAEMCTPEAINFMAIHGRGLICLSLSQEKADSLKLPLMVSATSRLWDRVHGQSIEARNGVTTGISARTAPIPRCLPRYPRRLARRPGEPGACVPPARQKGRSAETHRPDRGLGGFGPPGRAPPPPE